MKEVNEFLTPLLVVIMVILSYQLYNLPNEINNSMNNDDSNIVHDTIIINKSDNLIKRNDLIYLKGEIIKQGFVINNEFEYNPKYPDDFLNGYANLFEMNNGGKYFIWSPFKGYKGDKLDGWFVALGGTWQSGEEYIPMIVPIVERNKK